MTHDPADRMVEPRLGLSANVSGDPEAPEEDVFEQALQVDGDTDAPRYDAPVPPDANPDDVAEQRIEVPFDDDDYPAG